MPAANRPPLPRAQLYWYGAMRAVNQRLAIHALIVAPARG
jgi:hypothetical protein